MEDIIGKKVRGFEFEGYPQFVDSMIRHNGKIGEIFTQEHNRCNVSFEDESWNYPYPEILLHIIEEEEKELDMENKELVGKTFTGFKFDDMKLDKYNRHSKFEGKEGIVEKVDSVHPEYTLCIFKNGNGTSTHIHYPTAGIKEQLKYSENMSIDDILLELKQLKSQI